MSNTNRYTHMTEKKHEITRFGSSMTDKLLDRLGLIQKKIRKVTSVIPSRKLPLLTPAEPHGPDLERFRNKEQSLVSWRDKQTQWWYVTGHLTTEHGRPFGFMLAFFERRTQQDFFGPMPTRWFIPRAFAAHFAITDPQNADPEKMFRYWQRGGMFASSTGFSADDRFHVELGGWHVFRRDDGVISLFANADGESLHLELSPIKPLIYHGQEGFAQKGSASTHSAFSCSHSRMNVTGRLVFDGKLEQVKGIANMDHEKMTTDADLLSSSWDRFSMQLSTGEDLMLFLREEYTMGSWVDASGNAKHLIRSDIQIENLKYWTSPRSGARYPIDRKIRIEPLDLEIEVKALVPNQELDTMRTTFMSYWEGAIQGHGKLRGAPVDAHGYMALIGYDPRRTTKLLQVLTRP